MNFLRLCELVIRKCSNIQKIHLVTGVDPSQAQEQSSKLKEMAQELLNNHKISFSFEFSQTLHDRLIRLNTGTVIQNQSFHLEIYQIQIYGLIYLIRFSVIKAKPNK